MTGSEAAEHPARAAARAFWEPARIQPIPAPTA
jgi:hypothetical protein